jgi:hypothetical protein
MKTVAVHYLERGLAQAHVNKTKAAQLLGLAELSDPDQLAQEVWIGVITHKSNGNREGRSRHSGKSRDYDLEESASSDRAFTNAEREKMSKEIEKKHHRTFEKLKHINDCGMEFWFARELQPVLDYSSWDKFKRVIGKAMQACVNSGQPAENHFS